MFYKIIWTYKEKQRYTYMISLQFKQNCIENIHIDYTAFPNLPIPRNKGSSHGISKIDHASERLNHRSNRHCLPRHFLQMPGVLHLLFV